MTTKKQKLECFDDKKQSTDELIKNITELADNIIADSKKSIDKTQNEIDKLNKEIVESDKKFDELVKSITGLDMIDETRNEIEKVDKQIAEMEKYFAEKGYSKNDLYDEDDGIINKLIQSDNEKNEAAKCHAWNNSYCTKLTADTFRNTYESILREHLFPIILVEDDIKYNIAPGAVRGLKIINDEIFFIASFGGIVKPILVPLKDIKFIYGSKC